MKNLCIIVIIVLCVSFVPVDNKAEKVYINKITEDIKLKPVVEKLSKIDSLLKEISNEENK